VFPTAALTNPHLRLRREGQGFFARFFLRGGERLVAGSDDAAVLLVGRPAPATTASTLHVSSVSATETTSVVRSTDDTHGARFVITRRHTETVDVAAAYRERTHRDREAAQDEAIHSSTQAPRTSVPLTAIRYKRRLYADVEQLITGCRRQGFDGLADALDLWADHVTSHLRRTHRKSGGHEVGPNEAGPPHLEAA
jgi:hypothetical protein